jgi:hypothetical protein
LGRFCVGPGATVEFGDTVFIFYLFIF